MRSRQGKWSEKGSMSWRDSRSKKGGRNMKSRKY